MILDARKGDVGYTVIDVRTGTSPQFVVWVNSDTAEWAQYNAEGMRKALLGLIDMPPALTLRKERRIDIFPEKKLVLFNMVDDDNQEDLWSTEPVKVDDLITVD